MLLMMCLTVNTCAISLCDVSAHFAAWKVDTQKV